MFKKILCLLLALSMIILLSLSAFASSTSGVYYNEYGYLTYQTTSFDSSSDYSTLLPFNPTLVYGSNTSIPSNYVQIGVYVYSSYSHSVGAIFGDPNYNFRFRPNGANCQLERFNSSDPPLYTVVNNISSSGTLTFDRNYSQGSFGGGSCRISCLVPVYDINGNLVLPESQVQFSMNTAIIGYNLSVNSQINSGDATSVTYYIFPASTAISGGSFSNIVPSTPISELTQAQEESFLLRGFHAVGRLIDKMSDLITDISSPKVSLSTSTSIRSSGTFNPDSYGVSYEVIGSGRLYPASGGGGISPTATLSLKDMISSHTGVYASSTLKLVAVVTTANTSFVATFDFAPASIVGGSPVPPSTLQGQVPYPDFDKPNSDFKDLADYLKQLMQANNDNSIRNNSNLLAMLNSIPWTNFVTGGFVNGLPNLSFMLDSLFDSLFDKFTAPTQEQINAILADINTERSSLRAKLAFVDDVKTEYYFVISTITADNNSVPPDFEFSLPSIWSNGQDIRVNLISYELATPEIMANIKQVITVFLSLALLLHIWRTLPATVGNMPRGDD